MFNIGFTEFLVIGVIALLVIGPKQLPEVARVVGKLLGEIKNATQELSGGLLEVTREVKTSIDETKTHIANEGRKIINDVTQVEEESHGEKVPAIDSHLSNANEAPSDQIIENTKQIAENENDSDGKEKL